MFTMTTPSVPVAIDHDRLLKIFIDILSVDSYWGNEDRVVAILQPMLEDVGVVCTRDEIGNLIGKWPAKGKQTRPIMAQCPHGHGAAHAGHAAGGQGGRRLLRRLQRVGSG